MVRELLNINIIEIRFMLFSCHCWYYASLMFDDRTNNRIVAGLLPLCRNFFYTPLLLVQPQHKILQKRQQRCK